MSATLNKFRKRNIQTNWYHFMLVIFVVAVSVCLFFGLLINYLTLKNSVNEFYKQSNLPNLWIEIDGITEADEKFFENFNYSKRYCFEKEFKVGSGTYTSKFLVSDGSVSKPYIVDGERGKGCFVNAKFIDKFNIGINYSKISFEVEINSETKRVYFDVLGSISMAEDLIASDECVIFIDEDVYFEVLKNYFPDVSDEDLKINYNQILICSEVGEAEMSQIENYFLGSETELISIKTKNDIASFVAVDKEIKTARIMTWTFSSFFIIIAILVVISAISQLVLKERYNMGLLKCLGVSNGELLNNYSGYGAWLVFIGSVVGILLSPLIVPNVTFEKYDIIYNLPKDRVSMAIPVLAVILAVLIATIIGYLSAYFVCLNTIRGTPKECMMGEKIKIKHAKKSRKNCGILGWSFRSLCQNKSRTIMSVVGVWGSLVLIEIGFAVNSVFEKNGYLTARAYSSIFKGFSIVLIALTITILVTQIIKEKHKEMAILRVHGEKQVKIWMSALLEILIISAISFILSLIFCQPIFILMLKIFGINKIFFVNFLSYLKAFLLLTGLDLVLSLIILFKVYNLNLADATKFSE